MYNSNPYEHMTVEIRIKDNDRTMVDCSECLMRPESERDCYNCSLDPRSTYIELGYDEAEADYMWLGD